MYNGYEGLQQYGCKCDNGYRGADCSQVECPSGPDVMGGDGGAEGLDCSGRGLCNYAIGVCSCFRGWYGARCEQQSTLVRFWEKDLRLSKSTKNHSAPFSRLLCPPALSPISLSL